MAMSTAPIVAGSRAQLAEPSNARAASAARPDCVGGYLVARETGVRPLGGAVLAGAGALASRQWRRNTGPAGTAVLNALYYGGFGVSHPLAKKIGPWPAVLTVAGVAATASYILSDREA